MATVTMRVCDICRTQGRQAATYSIESEGRRASLDLCEDDSKVLSELLDRFSVTKRKSTNGTKVTPKFEAYKGSIEEVEAAKRK